CLPIWFSCAVASFMPHPHSPSGPKKGRRAVAREAHGNMKADRTCCPRLFIVSYIEGREAERTSRKVLANSEPSTHGTQRPWRQSPNMSVAEGKADVPSRHRDGSY